MRKEKGGYIRVSGATQTHLLIHRHIADRHTHTYMHTHMTYVHLAPDASPHVAHDAVERGQVIVSIMDGMGYVVWFNVIM